MTKEEKLALEVTRLARDASRIISNPNSTTQDRMVLDEILEELDLRKQELRNLKQKYIDFELEEEREDIVSDYENILNLVLDQFSENEVREYLDKYILTKIDLERLREMAEEEYETEKGEYEEELAETIKQLGEVIEEVLFERVQMCTQLECE